MKKLMTLLMFSFLALSSCKKDKACADLGLETSNIFDQEEYNIVEAILNEHHTNQVQMSQSSLSLINAESILYFIEDERFDFDSITVEEYAMLNDSTYVWGDTQFESSWEVINNKEFNCYFEEGNGGWESYYDKFENSDGVLRFGRPVVNDNDEAIVEYSHFCGLLCGSGYLVALKKEDGIWVIDQRVLTWVS